ncbi:hypothetical protein L2E82_16195 [Cichorium intybus]|uniref:Uncharacterized protein n=1 Tax=Cichorium intybus TaxID=13427 RepID=A0ACB9F4X3_CICIN|nr:hypothetical protein L2E82_16195 [Cichorium intybus]
MPPIGSRRLGSRTITFGVKKLLLDRWRRNDLTRHHLPDVLSFEEPCCCHRVNSTQFQLIIINLGKQVSGKRQKHSRWGRHNLQLIGKPSRFI